MIVFLNGQLIREEEAKISISDLSYQFGFGLYETIRIEEGIPVFFKDHYKRFTIAAKELDMNFPVDENEVRSWVLSVVGANKLKKGRLKITVSKRIETSGEKFNVLITLSQIETLPLSYSLLGQTLSRDKKSISSKYKTTSKADSFLSHKQAIEKGFNDMLFLNEKNEIIECTRSNIFLITENKIITPLLESGILSGITRQKILGIGKKENIEIEEKNVHNLYLNKTIGAFVSSVIIGVMPVSRIKLEDKEYSFSIHPKINLLKNLYDAEVKDYIEKVLISKTSSLSTM